MKRISERGILLLCRIRIRLAEGHNELIPKRNTRKRSILMKAHFETWIEIHKFIRQKNYDRHRRTQ